MRNAFDAREDREKTRREMEGFGTGEFLMRPEDSSIQGASEDFMKYLQNPIADMTGASNSEESMLEQDALNKERQVFDDLKGNNTPPLPPTQPQVPQNNQNSGGFNIGSNSSPNTVDPKIDILEQLKAARAANEKALLEAKGKDSSVELANALNKSFNQIGTGIANQAGYTKIASNPLEVSSDELKFAAGTNKEKLDALMQEYGIKKGIEDSKFARDQAAQARRDRLADKAEDRAYKDKMLGLEYAKLVKDKTSQDKSGQKKLDQEFAKEYNEWTSGGKEESLSSIDKIQNVVNRMKNGIGATRTYRSLLPFERLQDPELLANQSDVQSEAVKVIKKVLSGATSDKDVERITKTLWNTEDSNENNIARLERFIEDAKKEALVKDQKAKYFEKQGNTLEGFEKKETIVSNYPKKLSNGKGKVVTVSNEQEETEAKSEGWQ